MPNAFANGLGGIFIGFFNEIYYAQLPHRAVTVYMYLKDRSDRNHRCYPAMSTIAAELHLSRRTVQRAVGDLEKAGYIKTEQR